MPPRFVFEAAETVQLEFGRFYQINIQTYGAGDILIANLPLVTANDVGRRIGIAEYTGSPVGPGNGEVHITTSGGQVVDLSRTPPLKLAGIRPRIVFVAVTIATDTEWGWAVESWGVDP